jgi:5-methylcytosine-specific restriction protein B
MINDENTNYFLLGASFEGGESDQLERFVRERVWENGHPEYFQELVQEMRVGDRVAVKATYTQKNGLPFDAYGKTVSAMRIKATGIVTSNAGDGRHVGVDWTLLDEPRDWYHYTYQGTVWKLDLKQWKARALVDFVFNGAPQDIERFRNSPEHDAGNGAQEVTVDESSEASASVVRGFAPYTTASILEDGCFLPFEEVESLLQRARSKKNLILQGPPGTGKTWLAKRIGYALCGEKPTDRVRSVQFHPTLSYEDFVRGWRPVEDGKLALADGIFLEMVNAAKNDPSRAYVLVIEEINRGNPAQIFGELLTLIEAGRRHEEDALELCYRSPTGDNRVYVPANLFIIGTMNLADRSLAIVDFALRRRFAFANLKPTLGSTWHAWVTDKFNVDQAVATRIELAMTALNAEIEKDSRLGAQYCVGHSYVTPHEALQPGGSATWFRAVVESEIAPLLEEYYFDAPDRGADLAKTLLGAIE